jgi:hypothetical protein
MLRPSFLGSNQNRRDKVVQETKVQNLPFGINVDLALLEKLQAMIRADQGCAALDPGGQNKNGIVRVVYASDGGEDEIWVELCYITADTAETKMVAMAGLTTDEEVMQLIVGLQTCMKQRRLARKEVK